MRLGTIPQTSSVFLALFFSVGALGVAQIRSVPEWTRGAFWYQIMPDRFRNGDTTNDPVEADVFPGTTHPWSVSPWGGNWYRLSAEERKFSSAFYDNAFLRQYGGDLRGLIERLDYLKDLGVDVILLSPVFEGLSAHKYDVSSLHHVDRHFGPIVQVDTSLVSREDPVDPRSWYLTAADRLFLSFLQAAHERGIHVVVDVEFTHVSVDFWAFRDVLNNQEKSPYGSWFFVDEWDRPETPTKSEFQYRSMWNIPAFPLLRTDTTGLVTGPRDYVFAATKKWMDPDGNGDPSDGIDGWRVDLTHSLPLRFWKEWVGYVKGINPSAFVLSRESYARDEAQPFDVLASDEFARLAVRFFLNGTMLPSAFDEAMTRMHIQEGDAATDARINRISDLETGRIASMCANPRLPYDVDDSPAKNDAYDFHRPDREARALQKLLTVFQFTFPGSPEIVYGDEAGMWGGNDPDCRKPMLWPEMTYEDECSRELDGDTARTAVSYDSAVGDWYRGLVELRRAHLSLRQGSFRTLLVDDSRMLFGYERSSGADRAYVLFNLSSRVQDANLRLSDCLPGSRVDEPLMHIHFFVDNNGLTLSLPPHSGVVLVPR